MRAITREATADFVDQRSVLSRRGRPSPPRERPRSFDLHSEPGKELSHFVRIGVTRIGEATVHLGALLVGEQGIVEIREPFGELVHEGCLSFIWQLPYG